MIENKKSFIDKFHISEARYVMLFSFENIYGIFRPKEFIRDTNDSSYYNLESFTIYDNDSPDDVLKDIVYMVHARKLKLRFNDVICIKLNGFVISYRFCGSMNNQKLDTSRFSIILDFLKKERESYISALHKENMVLSILEGLLYSIASFDLKKYKVYCIEQESYGPANYSGNVITNYSLYALKGTTIQNMNPTTRPFVMMNNALYFFYKSRKKNKKSLLLYDKRELELLRDHMELSNLELVI